MTTVRDWVAGARPRTLPAAVVPVLVGTAVAAADGTVIWWRSLYGLIVALAIQIGTNYANDYSDGVRGTDAERVGPVRLVAVGPGGPERREGRAPSTPSASPASPASCSPWPSTPWLIVVGAVCFAAGWFYSGGSRPYGYSGFGEVFVFVFFGLVAVVGTAYVEPRAHHRPRRDGRHPRRLPRHRPAGGQQPPRHRDRQSRREEDPRRTLRGPRRPGASTPPWSGGLSCS